MHTSLSKQKLREFGLLFGILLPFLLGWLIPYFFGHPFRSWTLLISIPVVIIAIIKPKFLNYLYICWIKIGNFLGWINNHIILGLIFVLVLLPIAFIMRLSGYNPINKKVPNKNTYRETIKDSKINFERIF